MENKNKGLIILTIVLVVLVIGLGGYIIYDKLIISDSTKNNIKTNESLNIDENKKDDTEEIKQ